MIIFTLFNAGARGWVFSHSYYDTTAYENILKGFVGESRMIEAQRSPKGPKVGHVTITDLILPIQYRIQHSNHINANPLIPVLTGSDRSSFIRKEA